MSKRGPVTLYFITGAVPTEEQQAEIDEVKGEVRLRNVLFHNPAEAVEEFDKVAGDVPPLYLDAAAEKEANAEAQPEAPPASSSAPAAPQQTVPQTQASAKPKPTSAAWKANA